MRKSRFTEEQIVAALKEHAAGAGTGEMCRRLGISQETLCRWKRKYGGMEVSEEPAVTDLHPWTGRGPLVAYMAAIEDHVPYISEGVPVFGKGHPSGGAGLADTPSLGNGQKFGYKVGYSARRDLSGRGLVVDF